jgi:hypothetical protein
VKRGRNFVKHSHPKGGGGSLRMGGEGANECFPDQSFDPLHGVKAQMYKPEIHNK